MGVLESASGSSCYRGLEYFKLKKVKNLTKLNENEFKSMVEGTNPYHVYLNIEHPKKSTCNCPLANGKKIICKHIVATYFSAVKNSAEKFEKEQERLQYEYEDYQDKLYNNVQKYIGKLSKKDLEKELKYILDYAPEWVYEDFVRRNNIE